MKLAEALIQRKDLRNRLALMHERLRVSVIVQEGERAPEDARALLVEADALVDQLAELNHRINRANLATTIANGETITHAIARRDALTMKQQTLASAISYATAQPRITRTEIKSVVTVDVAGLRARQDALAVERRELDTQIQRVNWEAEMEIEG